MSKTSNTSMAGSKIGIKWEKDLPDDDEDEDEDEDDDEDDDDDDFYETFLMIVMILFFKIIFM
jgi:hypothetical protein